MPLTLDELAAINRHLLMLAELRRLMLEMTAILNQIGKDLSS